MVQVKSFTPTDMRELTPEERQAVDNFINNMSITTPVTFDKSIKFKTEHEIVPFKKTTTLYAATIDGYRNGYGSMIYLLGVFDNEEKAKQTGGDVHIIQLNKEYPLKKDSWGDYFNDLFLGGYYE